MRATSIAVVSAVVLLALMASALAWLIVTNSALVATNARLERDSEAYRDAVEDILKANGHFTVTPGWSGQSHVDPVKRGGAQDCFACHDETTCSDCHIRQE